MKLQYGNSIMEKFYLNIHSDTFIWIKEGYVCIYSTNKGVFLKHVLTQDIEKITNELLCIDNLYTTIIDDKQLSDINIKEWVDSLLSIGCCTLQPCSQVGPMPISLQPILKITDNIEYYKACHSTGTNETLLTNLHRLIVHLNNSEYGDDFCATQCLFPYKKKTAELDYQALVNFILSSGSSYFISEVCLVGNVWNYSRAEELLNFLEQNNILYSISCTETDFYQNIVLGNDELFTEQASFTILKNNYKDGDEAFAAIISKPNLQFDFLISSESEYEAANELIEVYKISNFRIVPYFNKKNHAFLEENVFTSEDEISTMHLSKREIFMHQTLNSNYFGTLIIQSDGIVTNGICPIGNIFDSLYDLVYKEMNSTSAWFHIRNEGPCKDCIYQWLCPSPSYFEFILNRMNLCSIKKR